jgi:hypothetical protein
MHLRIGRIVFILTVAAVFFGWQNLSRSAYETVVLRIPSVSNQDTYVNLWVAEDARNIWIRAESPERLWLQYVGDRPVVDLQRQGETTQYVAVLLDNNRTRSYVDDMFRSKYGLADEVRGFAPGYQTVPIRLERP